MARPRVAGDDGRHDPYGARPGDQHVLTKDWEAERGVHGVSERVEDRRHVKVDVVGVTPDIRGGKRDVLGIRARVIHSDPLGTRAHDAPARDAVATAPADEVAFAAHEIAYRELLDIYPELDDLADELMSDNKRDRHVGPRPLVPGVDVEVCPAHSGAKHLDKDVAPADDRHGDVLVAETRLRLGLDESFHR